MNVKLFALVSTLLFFISCGRHESYLEKQNIKKRINLLLGDTRLQALSIIKQGKLDDLKKLIDGGVDVNAVNENKETLLMIATDWNHPVLVEYLLQMGADKDLEGPENKKAIDYAQNQLLKSLIQGISPSPDDVAPYLFESMRSLNLELLEFCFKYDVELNELNEEKKTPLIMFIKHYENVTDAQGKVKLDAMIKAMIQNEKVDLNMADTKEELLPIIHYMTSKRFIFDNQYEIMQLFLEKADLLAVYKKYRRIFLHQICKEMDNQDFLDNARSIFETVNQFSDVKKERYKDLFIIQDVLPKRGSEIPNETFFHCLLGNYSKVSFQSDYLKWIKWSLELDYPMDFNIKDAKGKTPLELARSLNLNDVVLMMEGE